MYICLYSGFFGIANFKAHCLITEVVLGLVGATCIMCKAPVVVTISLYLIDGSQEPPIFWKGFMGCAERVWENDILRRILAHNFAGWCFGTFVMFPYIGNVIIPID